MRPLMEIVKLIQRWRIGAHGTPIFFVHPKDMGGMLTEIMEMPKDGTHWSN